MSIQKNTWIGISLANLCLVAFFGLGLRTKILFTIPFINYRNLLSAHSHFAFGGWAGLALICLLIYGLLPLEIAQKKKYQWTLAGIAISSWGMAFSFPFVGYTAVSTSFSSLYIFVSFYFAAIFIKDLLRAGLDKTVRILAVSSIGSLVISAIGPLGLAWILLSKSGNSLLYRDSIYTFLHFQYNGFFTLAIFALFMNQFVKSGLKTEKYGKGFSILLCLSIIPTLFLSLLWHNYSLFYILAAIGCILIIAALIYFFLFLYNNFKSRLPAYKLTRTLLILSLLSFILKSILNIGTIFPALGNAVYGDRPVIIGFLHLVFLGFVTFFILAYLLEAGFFKRQDGSINRFPFLIFSFGIIANELLLMLQGLGILFKTNSYLFNWLLWVASIILFLGSCAIAISFKRKSIAQRINKGSIKDVRFNQ